MKSNSFEYVRALSLDEVFAVLSEHGDDAKILAGGQSLIPTMNMRFAAPDVLIDLANIDDLGKIEVLGDNLRIGAMARHVEVLKSDEVARHAPVISMAMPSIAHAAIRNRGTFGGSLCNADPASELPACALALGASFNIGSAAGYRTVPAEQFFLGTYTTCLADDEVLISVDLPLAGDNTLTFFDEVSRRKGDYAMAGLAAKATAQGGRLKDVRLVFFAVSEKAVSSPSAETLLSGTPIADIDIEAICQAVGEDIKPFDDLTTSGGTKLALMKTLTKRATASFVEQGKKL